MTYFEVIFKLQVAQDEAVEAGDHELVEALRIAMACVDAASKVNRVFKEDA